MDEITIRLEIDTTVSTGLKQILRLVETDHDLLDLIVAKMVKGASDVRVQVRDRA